MIPTSLLTKGGKLSITKLKAASMDILMGLAKSMGYKVSKTELIEFITKKKGGEGPVDAEYLLEQWTLQYLDEWNTFEWNYKDHSGYIIKDYEDLVITTNRNNKDILDILIENLEKKVSNDKSRGITTTIKEAVLNLLIAYTKHPDRKFQRARSKLVNLLATTEPSIMRNAKEHIGSLPRCAELIDNNKGLSNTDTLSSQCCSICLGDIADSETNVLFKKVTLACSDAHSFHQLCIGQWFSTGDARCPLCRGPGNIVSITGGKASSRRTKASLYNIHNNNKQGKCN